LPTAELSHEALSTRELAPPARPRLHFLDGIRGLAALLVVLHHMWTHSFLRAPAMDYPLWFRAFSFLKYGHHLVAVFIVLSGFCLMLPVVMAGGVMKNGVMGYIKRRARRLLPPYYAALALSTALLLFFPSTRIDDGTIYGAYHRDDMAGSFIAHLFLVHNLWPNWASRIDGPMWSVATEWQIYFVFPFVLLPLWRKWGYAAPIAIGIALGLAVLNTFLREASFWYIGLFAMGMAACGVCFTPNQADKSRSWLWGAGALALVATAGAAFGSTVLTGPCIDIACGVLTASLLIYCTRRSVVPEDCAPLITRILSSRPIVALGGISYSLYLTHFPLLLMAERWAEPRQFRASVNFEIYAVFLLPLMLLFAYLFHRVFEKPFLNSPNKR
jgi:peptidoglycan/LPS O-acetylase OafA/YrhL